MSRQATGFYRLLYNNGKSHWTFFAVLIEGADKCNFLFILGRNEATPATRCFQFAMVAHSKGHKVDLFLTDDGVFWADKNRDFGEKTPTGDCPNDFLPYLVENEVPIYV